jgi:hypothetical protein
MGKNEPTFDPSRDQGIQWDDSGLVACGALFINNGACYSFHLAKLLLNTVENL